jgi:hypothetical protein
MVGTIPTGTAALWLGNDAFSDLAKAAGVSVFAMDLGGNLLIKVENTAMTGVAFEVRTFGLATNYPPTSQSPNSPSATQTGLR